MSLKRKIKQHVINNAILRRVVERSTRNIPRILLYHRFCAADEAIPHRVGADVFRRQLEHIAKYFNVMSFADCLEFYHQHHQWPKNTVVVTVDDGYRDFYDYAYPQLKALSLPATFFVTVNFVDQKIWLWPDRLDYALRKTSKIHFSLTLNKQQQDLVLNGSEGLFPVWKQLSDYCIASADVERQRLIAELEAVLDVDVPKTPTTDYAAVSWAELREMAAHGVEIGCHTMNHPILSKIPTEQLSLEIAEARAVMESKLQQPVKTFCYPNGQPGDINDTVISVVKNAGYLGAPYWFNLLNWEPYTVPRIGVSTNMDDFIGKLAGFEYLGQRLKKKGNL